MLLGKRSSRGRPQARAWVKARAKVKCNDKGKGASEGAGSGGSGGAGKKNCLAFVSGKCQHGANCKFSHSAKQVKKFVAAFNGAQPSGQPAPAGQQQQPQQMQPTAQQTQLQPTALPYVPAQAAAVQAAPPPLFQWVRPAHIASVSGSGAEARAGAAI